MRRLILLLALSLGAAGCSDALAQAVPPRSSGSGSSVSLNTLPTIKRVCSVGDSITQGTQPGISAYYPNGMHTRQTGTPWQYLFQNFAIPGQSVQTIATNTGSNLGIAPSIGSCDFFTVLGGINDLNLGGRNASNIETDLATIYDYALANMASGGKLVLFTIMPFHSASTYNGTKETIRTDVNTWITGTYAVAHASDVCVSDSAAYMSNAPTDSTYLLPAYEYNAGTDGIHVNQTGEDRLGLGLQSCLP